MRDDRTITAADARKHERSALEHAMRPLAAQTQRFNAEVVRLRALPMLELIGLAADELRLADDRNRALERRALALVLVELAGGAR